MTKAAFYILPDQIPKTRDLYACRLAAKAYNNKLQVYIYTASREETEAMDIQLWTFNDISFIPHKIYTPTMLTPFPPVLIGNTAPPSSHHDVLINLTNTLPNFTVNFSHIIEVIPNNEELRQKARERYKYYQKQNYDVITHDLNKAPKAPE